MADGIPVTPGAGAIIATKDAGTPGDFVGVASGVQVIEQGVVSGGVAYARPQTGTVTSVSDTASSTTLLSASGVRKGFRVFNDSTQTLYVKYGTTASASDYTVRLLPYDWLVEDAYGGRVDGIWAANASGAARITELA